MGTFASIEIVTRLIRSKRNRYQNVVLSKRAKKYNLEHFYNIMIYVLDYWSMGSEKLTFTKYMYSIIIVHIWGFHLLKIWSYICEHVSSSDFTMLASIPFF